MVLFDVGDVTVSLSVLDLLIFVCLELFVFKFSRPKRSVREIAFVVFLINAVKVGFVSLAWVSNPFNHYYFSFAFVASMLLMIGYILSTLLYQREFFMDRSDATSVAFQGSLISSLVWFFVATTPQSIGKSFSLMLFLPVAEFLFKQSNPADYEVYKNGYQYFEMGGQSQSSIIDEVNHLALEVGTWFLILVGLFSLTLYCVYRLWKYRKNNLSKESILN